MTDPWDHNANADAVPPVPSAPPTTPYPVNYPPISSPPGPYPVSGTPSTAPLPVPYPPNPAPYVPSPAPYPSGYPLAAAPGIDPMTGLPLSNKSKVVAGVLQLVLGFLFTLGGVGRLYAGNVTLGVVQLVASVVAWSAFWCGFFAFVPFFLWGGIWLWFIVDGIVMLAGRPLDGQGRPLRT